MDNNWDILLKAVVIVKKLRFKSAALLLSIAMLFSIAPPGLAADSPSAAFPALSEQAAADSGLTAEAPSPASEYDVEYYEADALPENIRSLVAQSLDEAEEQAADDCKVYLSSEQDAEIPVENRLNQLRIKNPETGIGTMQIYSVPIKYLDEDGEVQFIDTSLVPVPAALNRNSATVGNAETASAGQTDYVYQNAANSFRTLFARTAGEGVQADGDFRLSVADANAQDAEAVAAEEKNGAGKVLYPGAFGPGTVVEYVNTEAGVKENIVLDANTGRNRFDFYFESETCVPMLTEDQTRAYVVDKNDPDEVKYWFSSIYAYDSWLPENPDQPQGDFRHFNEEGIYELISLGENQWKLTVVVPAEYLNHPDVVYPVTIDPSYTTTAVPNGSSVVSDVFFDENGTRYNTDYLRFGNTSSGTIDSYIRFDSFNSHIPASAEIIDATMILTFRSGQTTGDNGKLTRVTASWSESSTTRPGYDTEISVTANKAYVNSYIDHYAVDMYEFARKWRTGYFPNYGVRLTYASGMLDYNSVVSSDGKAARAPRLQITYQTFGAAAGIESGSLYFIKNYGAAEGHNYLDITGNSTANGATAQLYRYAGAPSECWQLEYLGNGYYSIRTMLSSTVKMLDGRSNCVAGAQVVIYDYTTYYGELANSLQWRIVRQTNGNYQFFPKRNSELALSVSGTTSTSNPAVKLDYASSASIQQWGLEKSLFGDGGEYRQVDTKEPNCFGYALFSPDKLNPSFSWAPSTHKTEDYLDRFESVLSHNANSYRRIESFVAHIQDDEYRIAIRCPYNLNNNGYNYHVIYQLSDGTWAGKDDTARSKHFDYLGLANPSTSSDMWSYDAYSPSAGTVYYAVRRKLP